MDCNVLSEAYIKTCSLFLLQRCATVRPLSWWCSVGILENWAKELKPKELFLTPKWNVFFEITGSLLKLWWFQQSLEEKKSVAATVTHFHSQSCWNFWALDSVDSDTRLLGIYVISLAQSNYHHCLLKTHLYLCKLCAIETKAQDVCVCSQIKLCIWFGCCTLAINY